MKKICTFLLAIFVFSGVCSVSAQTVPAVKLTVAKNQFGDGMFANSASFAVSAAKKQLPDLYDLLGNAVRNHTATVDISDYGITVNNNGYLSTDIVHTFEYTHPESFVLSDFQCYYDQNSMKIVEVALEYAASEAVCAQQLAEYDRMIAQIAESVPGNVSDLEKVLYVHDYICANYQYDTDYIPGDHSTTYDANSAYYFLKENKGVCQAYAKVFYALTEKLGIEVYQAYSVNALHIWNIVKIDGKYYHIDTTYDDPKPDRLGQVDHTFFMVSSQKIYQELDAYVQQYVLPYAADEAAAYAQRYLEDWADYLLSTDPDAGQFSFEELYEMLYEDYYETLYDEHYNDLINAENRRDWTCYGNVVPICDATDYDNNTAWQDSSCPFLWVNNGWYVVNDGGQVIRYTNEFSQSRVVYTLPQYIWHVVDKPNSYWEGSYSGSFALGDVLYGNHENGLWRYDPNANSFAEIAVPPIQNTRLRIYGSATDNAGNVLLKYRENPNDGPEMIVSLERPLLRADYSPATVLINIKTVILGFSVGGYAELLDANGDGVTDVRDLVRMEKHLAA